MGTAWRAASVVTCTILVRNSASGLIRIALRPQHQGCKDGVDVSIGVRREDFDLPPGRAAACTSLTESAASTWFGKQSAWQSAPLAAEVRAGAQAAWPPTPSSCC